MKDNNRKERDFSCEDGQEDGEKSCEKQSVRKNGVSTEERKGFWLLRIWRKLVAWKNALFIAVCEREGEIKHAKAKRILLGVGLFLFAVLFILFYVTVGKQIVFLVQDPQGFRDWLNGFDGGHVVVFIFLRIAQTVAKVIPGEPLEIAAGCAFGTWGGLLWCSVGGLLGSVIILFLGKRYGTKMVGLFVSPEKLKLAKLFKNEKGMNFTLFILFLIPGLPKDMFVWLFSLTDEKPYKFLLVSTIARIPSILTSTWCGHELVSKNYWLSLGIFIGTLVLMVGGGVAYGIIKKRHSASDLDAVEGAETQDCTEMPDGAESAKEEERKGANVGNEGAETQD